MSGMSVVMLIIAGSVAGGIALVLAVYVAVRGDSSKTSGIDWKAASATALVSAVTAPVSTETVPLAVTTPTAPPVPLREEFSAEARRLAALADKDENAAVSVVRLDNVRAHRACLRGAFNQATRRVIVVSPFLSAGALRADDVADLVRGARNRGVEVVVFIDKEFNLDASGLMKESCQNAVKALLDAGAKLVVADRVHHKTLIVDDDAIVDGSFNWFSAMRNERHPHFREERSNLIRGAGARRMVAQEMERLAMKCAG
ncbi:MAG: hypothetical protein ED859_15225 [Desulfuromonadales bacterium]|nr:MAG: hypothetical protein ED859_15225 [Desulfuromonadales bacterium]